MPASASRWLAVRPSAGRCEPLDAGGAEKPRHLDRARRRRILQRRIAQRRRAERRKVSAIERGARHERKPAAGIEVPDLGDVPRRLEQIAEGAEEAHDAALDRARRRIPAGPGRQDRAEEKLGHEALVPGGGFEVGAVRTGLALDLDPQLVPELLAPEACPGKLGE